MKLYQHPSAKKPPEKKSFKDLMGRPSPSTLPPAKKAPSKGRK